jgi:4-amino-4-deoxy-L-arabinose transferase-like glycosyltransferase
MTGPNAARRRRDALLLLGVLGLCALLYTVRLGDVAFLGKDEPKNAQAAREMMRRGDWVLTTLGGEPWYDKPIVYYWTALVGYRLFGVGELGARIGPVLAALLTVWLTAVLGSRLLGSRAAGALAALVLGTGLEFWWFARTAVTDALLACLVTASLTAYLAAREGIRPGLNLRLAWASAAAATLAKGPIGLLLPAMVVGADLLLARDWRGMRELRWGSGLALLAAIAGPYYALAIARSDGEFFRDFFLHYNVARFATDDLPHQEGFAYYLPVLLFGPFPWSAFLPSAAIRLTRTFRALDAADRARMRTLALWVILPLVFFSLAGSKLPSYLLPAFPALAVILAGEIFHLARAPAGAGSFRLGAAAAILTLISLGVGFALVRVLGEAEPDLHAAALPLAAVLAVTGVAAVVMALLRRRRAAIACVGLSAVLGPLAVVGWGLAPLERRASAKEIALVAMALEPGPGRLLSYRFYDNSFYFYTDAGVERFFELRWIEDRVAATGAALCFVRERDLPEVRSSPRVASEEVGQVGEIHLLRLQSVLGRREPPGADAPAAGPRPADPPDQK